ncbi:uncharacterized protein [Diabrotica undecimpunctata]|uniref:uncharacterized protein n=1 Tax=Diabrotica undecimpunctata TaxID=50387 RepID=UPI003B63C591
MGEEVKIKDLKDNPGIIPFNLGQTKIHTSGVATLVKKSLSAKEFPVTTNLEVVVVEIQSSNRYFICNVYLPSSRQVTYNDLKELFNQIPSSRIIVGDFNSHNIIWGSSYSNARGKIVENIISDFQLNFLNGGSPTRFNINTGNSSAIDLSLCDPALTPRLFWEVLQYTYGSDHHPIVIKNSMALTHDVFIPRWKTETADWLKFENYIDNSMPNCKIAESIDESLHNLNSIIISSAEQFVGKSKKTKNNQTPVPWWNSECGAAIRATKKASWSKYVSEINTSTPVSEVWKKIRKISGLKYTPMISKLKVDNRISTSPQEIANTLAESFREMSSNSNYSDTFLERKIIIENTDLFANDNLNDPLDLPFTFEELENALSELKNTSPGLDDIPGENVKKIRKCIRGDVDSTLVKWFKQCRSSDIPVSRPLLKEKATKFGKLFGEDFTCSIGWLNRFKVRHSVPFTKIVKEAKCVDDNVTGNWLQNTWPQLRQPYKDEDISMAIKRVSFTN